MTTIGPDAPGRLRRLAEELDEIDPTIVASASEPEALVEEVDYALRPRIHERRVPSYGVLVEPSSPPSAWTAAAGFGLGERRVEQWADASVRLMADGIASWVVRQRDGVNDLVVFDRSVGSERDLTILADASGATIVQRHPAGIVRAVGHFGVLRHDGIDWQLEPPIGRWLDLSEAALSGIDQTVLDRFLRFAVHDVGARRIGATFVLSPGGRVLPAVEQRCGRPPALSIQRAADLAPLHHILGQLDGAAVFDETGTLHHLGVRLVPSVAAETGVDPLRGTRHTSALRYSYDDPDATIIVVSEDGPVSVLRGGNRLGHSD